MSFPETILVKTQVNFLTKLVALRPGKTVAEMIRNVMLGKNEGEDKSDEDDKTNTEKIPGGITGRVSYD